MRGTETAVIDSMIATIRELPFSDLSDMEQARLGLAIARRLLEQMQGKIQVFSPIKTDGWISENADQPPEGKGTTVVVELAVKEP